MKWQMISVVAIVILLSVPAGSQPAAEKSASDAVLLQDLDGSTIVAEVTREQRGRRENREFKTTYQQEWTLVMGPGNFFQVTFTPTSLTPSGKRKGKTNKSTIRLDDQYTIRSAGGGEATWMFRDGVLSFLRTYRVGAGRMTIEFTRGVTGLQCTANYVFAYEDGKPYIVLDSTINGEPTIIVGDRKVSSHCRVFATGQP